MLYLMKRYFSLLLLFWIVTSCNNPGGRSWIIPVSIDPSDLSYTTAQFERLQMTGAPMLILSGEKDDWVPTELCLEFTKDLKDAGYDANIIVYPDAHHAFDLTSNKVKYVKQGFSTAKCRYVIKSNGVIIETTSGLTIDSLEMEKKAFKACITKGAHIGGNTSARENSMKEIKNFITNKFGL